MSSSPMGAFDMPVDLSEVVMPKKRPMKVIHFQPMSNIFLRIDVPEFFTSTLGEK